MRSVADFRSWTGHQWPRHFPQWLAGDDEGLSWPLHPPSESQALAAPDEVSRWVKGWQREQGDGIDVQWVQRSWRSLGRQHLPSRVTATPSAAARVSGNRDVWDRAVVVNELLHRCWADVDFSEAVPGIARRMAALGEDEAVRLATVLGWLATHPEPGLWERELPVQGVDSKWFENHRALVLPLLRAVTGRGPGLHRQGPGFRVRLLDPSLSEGPSRFTVDLKSLSSLEIRPRTVLVCENLTTVATLPQMERTVAIHGMGFAASSLAAVPWVVDSQLLYWGDLDTYGLSILGQFRAVLPKAVSVLMDIETFEAHRTLAVREPRPFRGAIGHLSLAELRALAAVRDQDLRLEQERIPREWARPRLLAAIGRAGYGHEHPGGHCAARGGR